MILYLDTSALVKLYAAEAQSAEVKRWVIGATYLVSSLIAYTETRAALARKHRMRQMSDEQLNFYRKEFEKDWTGFLKVSVDADLVGTAGDIAERFGLKGYDAIHLASADRVYREARSPVRFASFDAALNRAATRLGLAIGDTI